MAPADDPETIAVRPDELLDLERLEPWLRAHLAGAEGPLAVRQFGGGHANLTYLLAFGRREFVLRRPPHGTIAPSAHDMAREHRVLARLWRAYPLAPRSFVHCADPAILGAEFHVMERRRGVVVREANAGRLLADPGTCARVGAMVIDILADLHRVRPADVDLALLGRPRGFIERQLEGWERRWQAARDDAAPDLGPLIAWLRGGRPDSAVDTLVHNDFKLDNVLVAADDPARAVAVLDWDMCTQGDPLADVGTLLNYWNERDDPEGWGTATAMPSDRPGFPTRRAAVERYLARSGCDGSRLAWYWCFATFRTAVILQQIYIRWLRGETEDARFASFGRRVALLARKAQAIAGQTEPKARLLG
ncbi:MAG: phosphotransferase family protein [Alphaproteobacteria bacterium]